MSHASRVGYSLENLRQQWAVGEGSYFQNQVATETEHDSAEAQSIQPNKDIFDVDARSKVIL